MKKIVNSLWKVVLSLLLGGVILYWTYRNFDFDKASEVLLHEMNVWWMLLSLAFGVLSHLLRGWRWQQTLEPMGERARASVCVNAIFISYAANLIIPRIGELSRCGVLARYDGVSFSKSLGTVVTERLVDMLCVALITIVAIAMQLSTFNDFFGRTGTDWHAIVARFTPTYYIYVAVAALIVLAIACYFVAKRYALLNRVRGIAQHIWEGITSLRGVKNLPLFIAYTLGIWICYFYHFYLTFYCFTFTADLGWIAGLVMFVAGTIAVIVPTPNGAGPWHFAVITMMVIYGINSENSAIFALIVHGIQTLLIILLGIYGLLALPFTKTK